MTTLERYVRLKKEAEQRQRAADRARGSLDQVLRQLQEEFSCKTLEDGQKLLAQLIQERDQLDKRLAQRLRQFEQRFAERLEE